ncbi:hypothetical protein [Halonatronum saccharophilum]|uniref:hypothetical protein n=1 Tax=Halonatronum saccharophilum TaxID=150060 RepID=UPI0004862E55|nr:hypothetical protein [Halonatronum saccharophilum]
MYRLKGEENFIIITGSDIIDCEEGKAICRKVGELIELNSHKERILLDLRRVNLEDSDFDIFIKTMSKINLSKVALVLPELISKFKFRLWKRRYDDCIEIEQFITIEEGKKWLVR